MSMTGSQRTLPPSSAYYTYGVASSMPLSPYGRPQVGSKPDFLENQAETFEMSRKFKLNQSSTGFLWLGLTDLSAAFVSFLVPLLVFTVVYALVSYDLRYTYLILDEALVIGICLALALLGYVAVKSVTRVADGASNHYAVWAAALCVGMLVAFVAALYFGNRNYGHYIQPYYEWQELNSYTDVDPSSMAGKAFMDAGALKFKAGSHLDTSKSSGFKNLGMYCVAPIVSTKEKPTTYDFWAVGLNCCTGAPNNFDCGDAVKTDINTGGLRLLSDSDESFYKLAVKQAATEYGIESSHPIFVHYVQDAAMAISEHYSTGWDNFVPAIVYFLVFQVLLIVVASLLVKMVKGQYAGETTRMLD